MGITEEELGKWFDDSIRHAVECIAVASKKDGLNPYCKKDWGKFYKLLQGKVNVDVRILTELLRNWTFVKYTYEKDFGKPRLILMKLAKH